MERKGSLRKIVQIITLSHDRLWFELTQCLPNLSFYNYAIFIFFNIVNFSKTSSTVIDLVTDFPLCPKFIQRSSFSSLLVGFWEDMVFYFSIIFRLNLSTIQLFDLSQVINFLYFQPHLFNFFSDKYIIKSFRP